MLDWSIPGKLIISVGFMLSWNLDLEALRLNGLPKILAPHWRTWAELGLLLDNFWGPGNLAGLDFETYTSEENKAIYWYTIAVEAHRNGIYIYKFSTMTIDFIRRFQISQIIGPFGLLNKYPENFLLPESAVKIKREPLNNIANGDSAHDRWKQNCRENICHKRHNLLVNNIWGC